MDAVINLVGLLHESDSGKSDNAQARRGSFQHAHVELPRKVVQACKEAGVPRLLHMSALGAEQNSRSAYQRSKAAGEALVMQASKANWRSPFSGLRSSSGRATAF
jgi:uncharacterized protein YbjT (DUF2867 family)